MKSTRKADIWRTNDRQAAGTLDGRSIAVVGLLVAATLAFGLSFILPRIDDGRSRWTDEQAEQLTEASRRLHSLSVSAPTAKNEKKLEQAEIDYAGLQQQLEDAQQHGSRVAFGLRVAAAGLVGLALLIKHKS